MQYQKKLFETITLSLKEGQKITKEVSKALLISPEQARRRIRNQTMLSFDEAAKLILHFNLSWASITQTPEKNLAAFHFQQLDTQKREIYANYILQELKKVNNFENPEMILTAKDLPGFSYYMILEILIFKVYYYARIWNNSSNAPSFSFLEMYQLVEQNNPNLKNLREEIKDLYLQIPSHEIWNESTLNVHLEQILYAAESGYFKNKEEALNIVDATEKLLKTIQHQAVLGSKIKDTDSNIIGAPYTMYYSEGFQLENIMLLRGKRQKNFYLLYNTGDYLATDDPTVCARGELYYENIISRSVVLSKSSEKTRNQLFKIFYDNINQLRHKIDKLAFFQF